ncbi:hypothetical protein Ddye_023584 [Dipteronia dyeriana]|uniref:Uncharacterized protein n=1 Tax=Dipteronia dyeriana TaxID=168575 RepID=A0AAD9WSS6_9ROSI|nr:hypothetical protein Ddye_023584 [Dipteronia dyeriana]
MTNRLRELLKTPEEEWYEGKLTRHDYFDALNRVLTEFADEDRRRYMASCLGHFMTMHRSMKLLGGVIHRLLLRGVHHKGPPDEMRFMLGTHKGSIDNGIHQRYFVGMDEISFIDLRDVLRCGEFQQAYDRMKLCMIYMRNWILLGLDEREKIPVWQLRLVENLDAFDAFLCYNFNGLTMVSDVYDHKAEAYSS